MFFDTHEPKGLIPDDPKVLIPDDPKVLIPDDPKGLIPDDPKGLIPDDPKVLIPDDPKVLCKRGGFAPYMQRCVLSSISRNEWGIELSVKSRSFG